jgi:hypothetical protein
MQPISFADKHLFHIKDDLKHPYFWWPETLVTYSLDFSADQVAPDLLALYNLTANEEVPHQLSNVELDPAGYLLSADVSFLTDLGSGEERRLELAKVASPRKFAPAIAVTPSNERSDTPSLWIDNRNFAMQIPASQIYPVTVPGPIMQARTQGGITYGQSRIVHGNTKIIEIVTECRESGPLFTVFSVKYMFEGGRTYEAMLKFVTRMEFIELTERMDNLAENDDFHFQLHWSGLNPTHRHAPNNPPRLKGGAATPYQEFNWDRIDQPHVGGFSHPVGMYSNREDGKLPFWLALYEPQGSLVRVNAATFWNERSGQSIGTFILDESKWDNGRYDLFSSWDGFAVSFSYRNGLLSWNYPLINGTRTTAIAVYNHARDKEAFESVRARPELDSTLLAGSPGASLQGASYCTFLQNRYSLLSLNTTKDYVLDYPENLRRAEAIFADSPYADAESFENYMMNYALISSLPLYGQRENAGFSPVPYRRMSGFAAAYNRFRDTLPYENRKRIEAMLLLLTYLAASEHVVPLLSMHGGPPNLQGDVKRSLGYVATLFPDHPEASHWKDLFAKFVETSLRLYTRPELPGLRLMGGRWAENLGTYTWAFLIPALKTAMLLEEHGGERRNVFANRHAAMLGNWLVHCLTAPFAGENEPSMALTGNNAHHWGCFPEGLRPHRVYLPIGAHAARRTPPLSMRDFARRLERYAPIMAENIHYICSDLADDFEKLAPTKGQGIRDEDRPILGTRPEFRTTAFTGFGVMLRGGVYTPEEISVFVQQIDEGPNYRWGTPGFGGNGNIYYYAGGKAYSHNGKEDAGDRKINDCEVGCNFGVWKDNRYVSIGPNVLTNAFHALGTFQYTAIESERDDKSYSFPEYVERNVLLSGTDYISIYDKTATPAIRHRFLWSVLSFDDMPFIHMLSKVEYTSKLTTTSAVSSIDSVWYEGTGDGFAIVSHREDLQVVKKGYGAVVSTVDFEDTLYRSQERLQGRFDGVEFDGTSGALRVQGNGDVEAALIQGYSICAYGIRLVSASGNTGISLLRTVSGEASGHVSCLHDDRILVTYESLGDAVLFVDSARCEPDEQGTYPIPAGEHTLELVREGELPTPAKPKIANVAHGDGLCEAVFTAAAGADEYEIELSADLGRTWQAFSRVKETRCRVEGLVNGTKYFVRVRGRNDRKSGDWSHEYPVYPSADKPLPPEGLDIVILEEQLHFSWGKILGALSYRLYCKDYTGQITLLYSGEETQFSYRKGAGDPISSYAVSAVNLNGEGEPCPYLIDDDTNSLNNYKPLIDQPFQRNSLYGHHPFKLLNAHRYREAPEIYPGSVSR